MWLLPSPSFFQGGWMCVLPFHSWGRERGGEQRCPVHYPGWVRISVQPFWTPQCCTLDALNIWKSGAGIQGDLEIEIMSKCFFFVFGVALWQAIRARSYTTLYQGGLRAGVPTSNNEFKQLSVFYGHTKAFYRCSGVYPVFDARCSMPPTSWKDMKMDF